MTVAAHPASAATHDRRLRAAGKLVTLECVDEIEDRTDKDARTVEITLAVVLGTLVAALPVVAVWLAGKAWDWGGGDWSDAKRAVYTVAIVAGAAVTVWWLVRSERYRAGPGPL